MRNKNGAIRIINGRFYASVTIPRSKKRLSLGSYDTRQKAQKAIDTYTNKRAKGKNLTFSEWFQNWINRSEKLKADSTISLHKKIAKCIIPTIGKIKLSDLVTSDIEKLYSNLIIDGKARSTVLLIHRILNACFNSAIQNGFLNDNPCKNAKKPRIEVKFFDWLPTDGEIAKLKRAFLKETSYKFPLMFGLFCGLRPGEAVGIKWQDLNLEADNPYLNIQRQVVRENGSIVEKGLKTQKSYRVIYLPKPIIDELEKIPASERKGYLTKRRFQAPENIRYRLRKICSDIDIKPLSPHKLRHLTATILLKDGIPINQVKEVLGHTSVKTTGDIYGHVLPSMQINVISTLSNIGM